MPTLQRPPDPITSDAARPGEGVVTLHGSSEVLLPTGDRWTRAADMRETAPADLSEHLDPAHVGRLVAALRAGSHRRSPAWSAAAFEREAERVRSQLSPIHDRETLAESFAREASTVRGRPDSVAVRPDPVAVGYALRWLELGDRESRRARRPWTVAAGE
jgi:hypothetical protein